MKAYLKNYRQSPRKVRLVADSVRGKDVERALTELRYVPKRASHVMKKLIESAISNAVTNHGREKDNLFIQNIRVDEGVTLKRMIPMSRGRAFGINKRTSNITLELGEKTPPEADQPKAEKNKK